MVLLATAASAVQDETAQEEYVVSPAAELVAEADAGLAAGDSDGAVQALEKTAVKAKNLGSDETTLLQYLGLVEAGEEIQ
jgi:hypothetical protein